MPTHLCKVCGKFAPDMDGRNVEDRARSQISRRLLATWAVAFSDGARIGVTSVTCASWLHAINTCRCGANQIFTKHPEHGVDPASVTIVATAAQRRCTTTSWCALMQHPATATGLAVVAVVQYAFCTTVANAVERTQQRQQRVCTILCKFL